MMSVALREYTKHLWYDWIVLKRYCILWGLSHRVYSHSLFGVYSGGLCSWLHMYISYDAYNKIVKARVYDR